MKIAKGKLKMETNDNNIKKEYKELNWKRVKAYKLLNDY